MKNTIFILALILTGIFQTNLPAQTKVEQKQLNVAIFVFEGVQIIDYTGPYEVLNGAPAKTGSDRPLNVYTVAEKSGAIKTSGRMSVNPTYSFENAPKPDILVIPGGGSVNPHARGVNLQVDNPAVIKWIQDNARDAKIVLSVCNGAFIAAEAGLLDGLVATTTSGEYIKALRKNYPKIKEVVEDKRFIDNGKVVVTGGLSSGIDGSLHVVEKLFGHAAAKSAALKMEYNWQPDSTYARAALADTKMPQSVYDAFYVSETELLDIDGDANKWEENYVTPSTLSPFEMLLKISEKFTAATNWTKANVNVKNSSDSTASWKSTDAKGQVWTTTATVQAGKEKSQLFINLKVFRAS